VTDPLALTDRIREESAFLGDVRQDLGRVLVGQSEMVDGLLIGLLADGHVLLEGLPGLAKTLAVIALGRAARARVPADAVHSRSDAGGSSSGGQVLQDPRRARVRVPAGAALRNFVLADEINRATPRTQSALLEAMQERQMTRSANRVIKLDEPFLRHRDAEPRRARRHLSAARGAARPLLDQDHRRISDARSGDRDRPAHGESARDAEGAAGQLARADPAGARGGGCDLPR
jgi:hypothetical protein